MRLSRKARPRVLIWLSQILLIVLVSIIAVIISSAHQPVQISTENDLGDISAFTGRHILEDRINCTPRSIDEFPKDFFTYEQKRQGGIIIHILLAIWLFAALAVVCDDYFVSSLEVICEVLHLKTDVAGATFMAAGSSAPELFTSIIGVFIAKSDVGVSTIVGSAVFNILFIVSLCGIFATSVIYLSWWPLFRDCGFYCLSVIALIIVISNGVVHWYEAVVFVIMYVLYIVLMYFNERLDSLMASNFPTLATKPSFSSSKATIEVETNERSPIIASESGADYSNLSIRDAEEEDEWESPFTVPNTLAKRTSWILMLPFTVIFYLLIPDCRRPGIWKRLFFLTFIMSVALIAGLSYLLVWMVCAIGDVMGIPDTVMGVTILAAGTSVPDAMASVIVARDGLGDMAVSNSVGSNVFDILVGLGVPWFIRTVFMASEDNLVINSQGLTFSSISLLSTVVFLFGAVYVNKMRLDKKLGIACFVVYLVFITFSILFEVNVFGYFNPPPCPRSQ